ncbi:hypothetical protein [Leuconostoc lactis]|uniref:hypothetical protein n=1 Tax=Leuconostoc lactis TaxID=1246 RepID=UPI0006DD31C9|nr:hypothetical protein [Leuconostoc lactis]KQB80962.1 hypothetical protein AN225_05525 [Leuconostoc lactis]
MNDIKVWLNTLDWGNVPDWFGAIGTILAVVSSVIIVKIQLNSQRNLDKERYMFEKQNNLLNDTELLSMDNLQILDEFDETVNQYLHSVGKVDFQYNNRKRLNELSKKLFYNYKLIEIHLSTFDSNSIFIKVDVFDELHKTLIQIPKENKTIKNLTSPEDWTFSLPLDTDALKKAINKQRENFSIVQLSVAELRRNITSA